MCLSSKLNTNICINTNYKEGLERRVEIMQETSLLDAMLSRGIHMTVEQFKADYTRNLKEKIFSMIESNEDPKVILKNIMDYLEKERVNCLYDARGW